MRSAWLLNSQPRVTGLHTHQACLPQMTLNSQHEDNQHPVSRELEEILRPIASYPGLPGFGSGYTFSTKDQTLKPEMGNPQLTASKSGAHRIHFQLQRPDCSQGDNKNRQAFVLTKLFFNGSFQANPVEVSTRQPLNLPASAQSDRAKALGRAGPLLCRGGLTTREAGSFIPCLR